MVAPELPVRRLDPGCRCRLRPSPTPAPTSAPPRTSCCPPGPGHGRHRLAMAVPDGHAAFVHPAPAWPPAASPSSTRPGHRRRLPRRGQGGAAQHRPGRAVHRPPRRPHRPAGRPAGDPGAPSSTSPSCRQPPGARAASGPRGVRWLPVWLQGSVRRAMNDQQNDQWGAAGRRGRGRRYRPAVAAAPAPGRRRGGQGPPRRGQQGRDPAAARRGGGPGPAGHPRGAARPLPGLHDDEVAKRLIDRAAKTAAGLAMLVGGVIAAQQAVVVVGGAPGGRHDHRQHRRHRPGRGAGPVRARGQAPGRPGRSAARRPRELAANVLGDVQAAGGWKEVRGRSLRRALPDACARAAARLAAMVPAVRPHRHPRDRRPPDRLGGGGRLALRQVRAGGEQHWGRLRTTPSTATWGPPAPRAAAARPTAARPAGARRPAACPASSAPPER